MGSRLPPAGEVLIIPPSGKKGSAAISFQPGYPLSARGACQEARHSKAGSECNAVHGMQLLLRCKSTRFPKSNFPRFQGAILMKKILLTVVLGVTVVAVGQN